MNIKKIICFILIILLINISAVVFIFQRTYEFSIDTVAVNDITQTLAEQWNSLKSEGLPVFRYKLDFAVIDDKGRFIGATRRGLNENVTSAVKNRDTIVDITKNGTVLGKLIIYNNTNDLWMQYRDNLLVFTIAMLFLASLFCILYSLYLDKHIFRPFRKLQQFAKNVAMGKLDMPLEMDRENRFGAFTESFDLMREELAKARENERKANQSKKELVASLSHDIKTPVASIKAVSEIMIVKTIREEDKRQLEIINAKADQINTLISNMFTATLEELQELKVRVTEESSQELYDLIQSADYNASVTMNAIPECIILIDKLRLLQVIDNIISNSYKYAGTSISFTAKLNGAYLELAFKDYGPGVSEDEIPLLFNKYYRAENSAGKSGTGLGLYISKYLMNKMSGDISCMNAEDGFTIILKLMLA